MPTYQYLCTECGEPLEAVQSFTDDALTECPSCGGRLRKVYNAVGIVFKGSGFYRNDSRAGSSSSVPAGKNGSDKSESKTDAKPAAKSESKSDSGTKSEGGSPAKSSKSTSAA